MRSIPPRGPPPWQRGLEQGEGFKYPLEVTQIFCKPLTGAIHKCQIGEVK